MRGVGQLHIVISILKIQELGFKGFRNWLKVTYLVKAQTRVESSLFKARTVASRFCANAANPCPSRTALNHQNNSESCWSNLSLGKSYDALRSSCCPQQFLHGIGNIKDPGAGTKFLFQVIHLPSAQRLLSEDSGKEQWDSYRIPDVICNFLLFLNLFSLSTFLPCTVFVPFPKAESLDGCDSPFAVVFLAPGFPFLLSCI